MPVCPLGKIIFFVVVDFVRLRAKRPVWHFAVIGCYFSFFGGLIGR
jgi:hypothetical protein